MFRHLNAQKGWWGSEAGLLNKSSLLAGALGVTKFKTIFAMFLPTFVVLLKSDLDVQQTHLIILCLPLIYIFLRLLMMLLSMMTRHTLLQKIPVHIITNVSCKKSSWLFY